MDRCSYSTETRLGYLPRLLRPGDSDPDHADEGRPGRPSVVAWIVQD